MRTKRTTTPRRRPLRANVALVLAAMLAICLSALVGASPAQAATWEGGWSTPTDPLPGISAGHLANNCGHPEYGSYIPGKYHIGTDYDTPNVPTVTKVYAIGAGTIIAKQANWPGAALFVQHQAGDGTKFVAVYGHINTGLGSSGTVSAGQQIGTVYNDHLHFGIRPGTTIASSNGAMPCSSWPANGSPDTNGYVEATSYLRLHPRSGSTPAPSGVGTRLVGDVNGDNLDDAVVMFRDSGSARVALSNGSYFGYPGEWSFGHSVGASRYYLGDVNGDNRDDLVAHWAADGRVKVSLSSGSGFWPEQEWAYGHGPNTNQQWVMDATGDGKADFITLDVVNGDWRVSASSGSGFWSPERWISGHGVGSTNQVIGDFNGDRKVDAAVYFAVNGNWHVGLSTGSAFGYPGQWSAGHGGGSTTRFAGDVNGDGKSDAVYFDTVNGNWAAGTSSGGGFWSPTAWAIGHGKGTTEQFLALVNGDSRADVVTFDRTTGDWWVSASSGSGFWPPQRWISGHGANS